MKGLNLSGWEKVSEDKKSTTLKHKNGHTMQLAHAKLPRIQCEALKRLRFAEGGEAPVMQAPAQSAQPVSVPAPNIPQTPNVLGSGQSVNPGAAAQTAQSALKLQADIDAAKAAQAVPQLQQSLNQQANLNQYDANTINALSGHADALNEYEKKTPIKPNAYLEDMKTGQKIATGLSLFLGGLGAGLTGGSNPALEFLNKQIDRNIQAQKDNFGQKQTIFGAYKQLYGDQTVASNMARVHQLDFLKTQAERTAAQLGTPTAAANLMKLSSEIAPERQKLLMDSAGRLQSLPNYQGSPSSSTGHHDSSLPDQSKVSPETQKLIDAGLVSGHSAPSAQASIPKEDHEAAPEAENNSILSADAGKRLTNRVQYGEPKAREDYQETYKQFIKAQQVEKQIKQINDLFSKMRSETTFSGNVGSHINPHALGATAAGIGAVVGGGGLGALSGGTLAIPGAIGGGSAGAAMGEGAGHAIKGMTDIIGGQKEVQYQTDKAGLTKFLINALGSKATGAEIDSIVETSTPSFWDNPVTYKKKLDNIKKFLSSGIETGLLDKYGLLSTK